LCEAKEIKQAKNGPASVLREQRWILCGERAGLLTNPTFCASKPPVRFFNDHFGRGLE